MNYGPARPLTYWSLVGRSLITAIAGSLVACLLLWLVLSIHVAARNGTPLEFGDWGFALGIAVVAAPPAWAGLLVVGIPGVLVLQDLLREALLASCAVGLLVGAASGAIAAGIIFHGLAHVFGMGFGAVIGLLWVVLSRPVVLARSVERD